MTVLDMQVGQYLLQKLGDTYSHLQDGTGGCDGCLNWAGVGARFPHNHDENDYYSFPPVNTTDNNGLENLVEALERIYTTIDWPFQV